MWYPRSAVNIDSYTVYLPTWKAQARLGTKTLGMGRDYIVFYICLLKAEIENPIFMRFDNDKSDYFHERTQKCF